MALAFPAVFLALGKLVVSRQLFKISTGILRFVKSGFKLERLSIYALRAAITKPSDWTGLDWLRTIGSDHWIG